jgi:hypothetical protein
MLLQNKEVTYRTSCLQAQTALDNLNSKLVNPQHGYEL